MNYKDIKHLDCIRDLLPEGHPALEIAGEGDKIPPYAIFIKSLEIDEETERQVAAALQERNSIFPKGFFERGLKISNLKEAIGK